MSSPGRSAKAEQKRKQSYDQGLRAERWACWLMRLKGFSILSRRYKMRGGEIDLICQRGDLLVFLEVKYRQSLDDALHAITPRNQARIVAAAESYLAKETPSGIDTYRFDVMVFAPAVGMKPQWRHVEAAFEAF